MKEYRCAYDGCGNKNIPDDMIIGIGNVPICHTHIKDPDLWRKIPLNNDTVLSMVQELIQLKIEKETPKPYKHITTDLEIIENLKKEMTAQNTAHLKEINKLTAEKKQLNNDIELNKIQITLLQKGRDLSSLEPVLTMLAERIAEIDEDVENSNNDIKKEIEGIKNELPFIKSDIIAKNNEGIDVVLTGINTIKGGFEQSIEASNKATALEIVKITNAMHNQSMETTKMFEDMKQSIANNNALNLSKIQELKTSTNNDLWEYLEMINCKLDKLSEPETVPEPVKIPVEVKELKKEELKAKREISIPQTLKNPVHISVYSHIASTSSDAGEITTTLGASDKDGKQKIYDALKALRAKSLIILDESTGKYKIITGNRQE